MQEMAQIINSFIHESMALHETETTTETAKVIQSRIDLQLDLDLQNEIKFTVASVPKAALERNHFRRSVDIVKFNSMPTIDEDEVYPPKLMFFFNNSAPVVVAKAATLPPPSKKKLKRANAFLEKILN